MAFSVKGSDRADVISEISVTPLVDVVLVLLVVLIVTAPLFSNAVAVSLPPTALASPPPQRTTISVSIDEGGKIFVDRSPVELAALEAELRKLNASADDVSVQLNADVGVNYGIVAQALSAIERGGVKRLSVLTASE